MDTRKNVAKKFKNTIDNCPCKVLYYQTREGVLVTNETNFRKKLKKVLDKANRVW